MRATLIYNAGAGGTETLPQADVQRTLSAIGYKTTAHLIEDARTLGEVLEDPGDLVVVAGGDGTVRSVVLKLLGRAVPLAVVPLGTANNIGRTLGLTQGSPQRLLEGLATPRRRYFDVGLVRAPWGEDHFLETAGFGLFAFSLAHHKPKGDKSPPRPYLSLLQALSEYRARPCLMVLDGEVVSGLPLFTEVMNTPAVGPQLKLALNADPGDGWLEVATIHEENRAILEAYLGQLIARASPPPPEEAVPHVTLKRARKVVFRWQGEPFHVDGNLRSRQPLAAPSSGDKTFQGAPDGEVEISLLPRALEVWLPAELENDRR